MTGLPLVKRYRGFHHGSTVFNQDEQLRRLAKDSVLANHNTAFLDRMLKEAGQPEHDHDKPNHHHHPAFEDANHQLNSEGLNHIIQALQKEPEERTECDLSFLMPVIKHAKFTNGDSDGAPLTHEDFKHICERLKFRFYPAGEFVMQKGDFGQEFFTIIKGTV
jgi:hypothetical protein